MTVNKITNPPSEKGVIDKINEIIDNLGGGGAVDSVNGQTGTVVLSATDVGALPSTTTASDIGAQPTLTAGTGITISSSNTIATTDPVLINTATHAESLTIWGDASSRRNTINIGKHSAAAGADSIMIGAYSSASEGAFAIGNGATAKNYGFALLGKTTANYAYQLGRGTNSETNSLYVGWGTDYNYKLLDNTGIIPNARINMDTTVTASSTNAVTSGAVSTALGNKQDTLVSGTNIKTINNESLLGSGNITISGGGSSTLSGLSDVTITSATSGQILGYNGSVWANTTQYAMVIEDYT